MNYRIVLALLGGVLLGGFALSQIRTAPTIRQPGILAPTVLRYPATAYKVEIVELTKATTRVAGEAPITVARDPYNNFIRNIGNRRAAESRLKLVIEQYGAAGWVLDRTEVMGEGGEMEEVMLVFRRPAAIG